MDCDECIERVFELIDEEASDPDNVRAILDRCPECRALFEATKANLALASNLPLDEPPAELDAAIRRAAANKVAPARKSKPPWVPQAPHWAMAAVAVLAIGLGMWSRRARDVRMEDELPAAFELDARTAEDQRSAVAAEEAPAAEALEMRAPAAEALPAAPADAPAEASADLAEAAPPASPARTGRSQGRSAPSKAKRERSEQAASKSAAKAPAVAAESEGAIAEPEAALADAQASEAEAASPASAQARERLEEAAPLRACRELVAEQARRDERARENSRAATEPTEAEAQLRLGRCYRQLGDRERARIWLERAKKQQATRERAKAELRALTAESN